MVSTIAPPPTPPTRGDAALPRRNRVTPFGDLVAVPEKGAFLGNRGDLLGRDHRPSEIRWICCTLEETRFAPPHFDTPGRYTPLFFCDEAVALAAGHRPCAACRRGAFDRFAAAWRRSRGIADGVVLRAPEIDRVLDAARFDGDRRRTHGATVGDLPDGAFFTRAAAPTQALLRWAGAVRPWTHAGYGPPLTLPDAEAVCVLTPAPIVAVLRAGYVAAVPSLDGLSPTR